MPKSAQKGIAHLLLIIVVLLGLLGGVAFFIFRKNTVNKNKAVTDEKATITTSDSQDVQLTKDYENPFDEKTQYSNPFEEEKNPFDYLNE